MEMVLLLVVLGGLVAALLAAKGLLAHTRAAERQKQGRLLQALDGQQRRREAEPLHGYSAGVKHASP